LNCSFTNLTYLAHVMRRPSVTYGEVSRTGFRRDVRIVRARHICRFPFGCPLPALTILIPTIGKTAKNRVLYPLFGCFTEILSWVDLSYDTSAIGLGNITSESINDHKKMSCTNVCMFRFPTNHRLMEFNATPDEYVAGQTVLR
jgi:hypothetical protein